MTLNVALIGYGKMGRMLEGLAVERGINIKSIVDPFVEAGGNRFNDITKESLDGVDVCIEFTRPDVVVDNVKKIAALGKNVVVGTTAWYDKVDEVKDIVGKAGIGFIYAHNFSIGVNLLFRVTAYAAKLFNNFSQYDEFAYELHHNQKVDSPSGTAIKLGEVLLDNLDRKNKLVTERLDCRIEPDELHFASVRGGTIAGTHVIGFDSMADTVEIKHTARGRAGFADGALSAAQWIKGKKDFYRFEDMMDEIIGGD